MAEEWIDQFRLSITRALADQLATTLAPLRPAPLTEPYLGKVENRPGVYVLFLEGERVYVGKASRRLQDRLRQHQRKLSGRSGLDPASVRFVCVYVDEDLDAAAPEKLLIKKYRASGSIPWNTNGFGNKDPGRNRDRSLVKAKHFDACYPIDLEVSLRLDTSVWPLAGLLNRVKQDLPYLLRYDNKALSKSLIGNISISLSTQEMTARQMMLELVAALPPGWQGTALPGYLILYPESRVYDSALVWWRYQAGVVEETRGPRNVAGGEVEGDDYSEDPDDVDLG